MSSFMTRWSMRVYWRWLERELTAVCGKTRRQTLDRPEETFVCSSWTRRAADFACCDSRAATRLSSGRGGEEILALAAAGRARFESAPG
jgi:hypothetical protein